MSDLTEFLLARIAEDEGAVEVRAGIGVDYWTDAEQAAVERVGSARVLAECEAKRRIVDLHADELDHGGGKVTHTGFCDTCGCEDCTPWDARWPCATIRALALPYADHPDYRQEWVL